ncbi:hypothetical protein ACFRCI_17080 [Streptomyces sp. NPDC056638]|uniref:hypothetical protein n=1 Tax=Streptomyces sp. NPDC056638 TaxID=3345887 RepID=UPI003689BDAC
MSAFDGDMYRVQAKWAVGWKGIRERFETDPETVKNVVKGFKGAGASAVKVERLFYVREPVADLSYGDPEELAKDW